MQHLSDTGSESGFGSFPSTFQTESLSSSEPVVFTRAGSSCREPLASDLDGRRIYVHQQALRFLAASDPHLCVRLADSLADVRATKLVHHQTEMALEIGLVSSEFASALDGLFGWQRLTETFRQIVYRPVFPKRPAEALLLLGHEEKVTASCSEAGYYTFATGDLAAELMFADHEPIPELQRALSAGEGPADLTMLRGRCLAALDPELGVGHVGRRYNAAIRRSSVSDAAIDEIDRAARTRCLGRLEGAVAEMSDCSTQGERSLMRDITRCLESSFEILRTL